MDFSLLSERPQCRIPSDAYDHWLSPDGEYLAEFFRNPTGFLVRFPARADFEIDRSEFSVRAWPAPGVEEDQVLSIFENSIEPIIGNHRGGLFLHGSAVQIGDCSVAFLGPSRSGKTTLACSCARQGYPLVTQDTVELIFDSGTFFAQPKLSAIRLFPDSAVSVLGHASTGDYGAGKVAIKPHEQFLFADAPCELRAIFQLGTDHTSALQVRRLGMQSALAETLPQAFILDVEDKARLRAHFERLADLTHAIPCFALDYERDYAKLPEVVAAVLETIKALPKQ